MPFLLDFSDIMKRASRSKPAVAFVCPMHYAWWHRGFREKERYWRVVRVQKIGMKYYILSKNCLHTIRFICDPLGMSAADSSYPEPLAGRLFYRFWTKEQSIKRARCPPSQNQGYWTIQRKSYILSKKWLLYCVACRPSQKTSLCWYPHLVISLNS